VVISKLHLGWRRRFVYEGKIMNVSEKEFEDYLYHNPEVLYVEKWIGRQIWLASGRLDLLGCKERNGRRQIFVVEVKMEKPCHEHVFQVLRYVHSINYATHVSGFRERGFANNQPALVYAYPINNTVIDNDFIDMCTKLGVKTFFNFGSIFNPKIRELNTRGDVYDRTCDNIKTLITYMREWLEKELGAERDTNNG
jgi:hypothetical protein